MSIAGLRFESVIIGMVVLVSVHPAEEGMLVAVATSRDENQNITSKNDGTCLHYHISVMLAS